jgi:NADH:ubiquinone oxidoreductase subunit C
MNDNWSRRMAAILDVLAEVHPPARESARRIPIAETVVELPADQLRPAVQALIEHLGLWQLSAITGQDRGGQIELLYHFWDTEGLTLRTTLPREGAHVATLTDLIPGAAFYEREVHEMLGVTLDGFPDPQPLLLPDDWDEGAPLRAPGGPGGKERRET